MLPGESTGSQVPTHQLSPALRYTSSTGLDRAGREWHDERLLKNTAATSTLVHRPVHAVMTVFTLRLQFQCLSVDSAQS